MYVHSDRIYHYNTLLVLLAPKASSPGSFPLSGWVQTVDSRRLSMRQAAFNQIAERKHVVRDSLKAWRTKITQPRMAHCVVVSNGGLRHCDVVEET